MNSAPLTRAGGRRHVPQHRQGRCRRPWSTSAPPRKQRAQELTEFFGGGGDDLLERFFGGGGGGGRGQGGRAARAAAARAGDPGRRHRLRHQQGRLHPHQQPRRRGRDEDRGRRSSARTPTSTTRPRSSARDPLTDSALIQLIEKPKGDADRSEVRRLGADGAGRLGDGHRQPLRPGAHRQRRRDQRHGAPLPHHRRPLAGRAADRRRDQPRQLGRPAAERARRGDRHQHRDLHRLAPAGQHRHRLRASRSTPCASCCRSCAPARSRAA